MAVLKCKMCGGELTIEGNSPIAECEYCGSRQTIPSADNEKKITLFERANRLRRKSEFATAESVYENLVSDFPEEAEGYWGLCLCKYGIEYVDDPQTAKKVPTCHRTSYESIFKDENFKMALEYADSVAVSVYREEAKEIDRLQKAILEIAQNESPYDIFICYKETDDTGNRTKDSVRAQEIYQELTKAGYKVFFSRISLEDKLGTDYEPYIFAALNSAKIMLAIGTSYDNYNAVWVKNEWGRFLKLMEQDPSKKLIPCYEDLDAYDIPEEFSRLQGQDMSKLGFLQDLIRGINKIMGKGDTVSAQATAPMPGTGPNVEALLQRGMMALEEGDWDKAKEFFDQVLSMDAKCFDAYFGMGMADNKIKDKDAFDEAYVLSNSVLYQDKNIIRAVSFCSDEQRKHFNELEEKRKADKKKASERIAQAKKAVRRGVLAGGWIHTVGVCDDGTVVVTGDDMCGQCKVTGWNGIKAIAAGRHHTVGLRANGTVIAVGDNRVNGSCEVTGWNNIIAIDAKSDRTIGLRADGTVVVTGGLTLIKRNLCDLKGIIAIAAGDYHIVGLHADGTVVVAGSNTYGECEVSEWKDIIAIAAGGYHTVGLREDGTVVAAGRNTDGQCQVSDWKDVIAIAAGDAFTIGLRSDGTVIATGANDRGQCDVGGWSNIISIAAGEYHTVGLRADGTVVAAGRNDAGQCKVDFWKLFYLEEEKEKIYNLAKHEMNLLTEKNYRKAVEHFSKIADYKDSKELRIQCEKKANELGRERLKAERIADIDSKIARLTDENDKLIERLAGLKGLKGLGSGTLKGELNKRIENNENELYSLKRQRQSLEEV